MKVETIRTQSNIKMNTVTQTLEVMGLKSKTTGPSAEWEWSTKEDKSNKTQTIGPESTSVQYPSAQAVYEAIQNIPGGEQIQSDWNQTDTEAVDYIKNKPVIPVVPTNVSSFINDSGYITLTDVPEQVNSDWNSNSGKSQILNKPNLSTVATSGSYTDLTNRPTIPVQAQSISQGEMGYATGDQVYQIVGDVESLLLALRGNV